MAIPLACKLWKRTSFEETLQKFIGIEQGVYYVLHDKRQLASFTRSGQH
jgi:hypothetical protein